ncbi:hypothetical protein EDB80DRAFT_873297 [Ilyonectria destructans]|nr:hypothetical protein EDB80DRAFT_873297 [Ilyonectria destructans]
MKYASIVAYAVIPTCCFSVNADGGCYIRFISFAGFQLAHERPSSAVQILASVLLPDASVDITNVVNDIHALKEVGAGGLQFLPFFNYGFGDPTSFPTSTWDEYGFGTPAFKQVFVNALKARLSIHTPYSIQTRMEYGIWNGPL